MISFECLSLVPLRFLIRPQRKVTTVTSTSGYVMTCEVTGEPKPSITWLQNGKKFTDNDRISIKPNGLEFAVIYSKDLGLYQCVADNGLNVIQSSAMLITAGMTRAMFGRGVARGGGVLGCP